MWRGTNSMRRRPTRVTAYRIHINARIEFALLSYVRDRQNDLALVRVPSSLVNDQRYSISAISWHEMVLEYFGSLNVTRGKTSGPSAKNGRRTSMPPRSSSMPNASTTVREGSKPFCSRDSTAVLMRYEDLGDIRGRLCVQSPDSARLVIATSAPPYPFTRSYVQRTLSSTATKSYRQRDLRMAG